MGSITQRLSTCSVRKHIKLIVVTVCLLNVVFFWFVLYRSDVDRSWTPRVRITTRTESPGSYLQMRGNYTVVPFINDNNDNLQPIKANNAVQLARILKEKLQHALENRTTTSTSVPRGDNSSRTVTDSRGGNFSRTPTAPNISTQTQHATSYTSGPFTHSDFTDDFHRTHFITLASQGRLGNCMFQFAAMLGACAQLGYTPVLRRGHLLRDYFNIPQMSDIKIVNDEKFGEDRPGKYDDRIEELSADKNWTLVGYYQSWKYFQHIPDIVRNSLQFQDITLRYVRQILQQHVYRKLRTSNTQRPCVGVHIRRGDMNTPHELKRGYNVADIGFIRKAMDYFRNKYSNPIFVIATDDKRWVAANVVGSDVIHHLPNANAVTDMALLAHCNHTIVTSGTFGWWAAWLAGGETVYYNNYPSHGSWLDSQYVREDYYPPHWIGME
jgi:galactoside 2-L-fucosyltransferase 1/2